MGDFQTPPGVELDIGNLAAFDTRTGLEGNLLELAQQGIDPLVQALFSLPARSTENGKLVDMPDPSTPLPREKPIPKERSLTKWEQFAKEKGIQKKKRDRLVFDEATGEYVPRYGKGSKNDLKRDIIIPHKPGMADGEDPFSTKRKEKKDRIKANKKKQLQNLGRAEKKRRAAIQPMQALDVAKAGPSGKKYLPKQGLKDALSVAQRSTGSAGRFDEKVANEPKIKLRGKKRRFETVPSRSSLGKEKERSSKIADRVLMGGK